MELTSSKLSILIDGQFGSTGKGLVASYLGSTNHIDIIITNNGPNSGHTCYLGEEKVILKMLPVSSLFSKNSLIYFCAGAIIDPDVLIREIKERGISEDRIRIHPRASIVEDIDREEERVEGSSTEGLASTQMGTGRALSRKVNRTSTLAEGCNLLSKYISKVDVGYLLDQGCTGLMEVPQGLGLSINSGLSYPYCTSREVTVSSALTDAGLHPHYLGKVIMVLRTLPIRVGNIVKDGEVVGWSGPFYEDSKEVSWDDLALIPERTTVTNRIRRVATFSFKQYKEAINLLRPDYVVLNFSNYLTKEGLIELAERLPEVTHLGLGPRVEDVVLNNPY